MTQLRQITLRLALALAAVLVAAAAAAAQAQGQWPIITKARVDKQGAAFTGPVYVTVNDQEKKVAESALEAWVIRGGRQVVYSGLDGSGGFEDEGQSLRVYDVRTGKTRKVMSEYVAVDKVTEVTTSRGKTALLVEMSDGGLGASYLAVVDPDRGEVFSRAWVRLLERRGDVIVMGHYKEDDWGEMMEEGGKQRVKPYKTERRNLSLLLRRRRVIYNKREARM
ncbi:MAG TPA: hypothetical protein VJT74_12595 [Pyrinomonadaceae bacterium]|nr:hypothetical protein [Pyrinomonadaceae bacterium]